jgi:transcriptional regulator with XRE-family HTH domain
MVIGDRIRAFREEKNLTQHDIEKRTGLLRAYISRVENGHTVPSIETIEKFARALEVPMYQLFYEGEKPPALANLFREKPGQQTGFGSARKEARYLKQFQRALGKASKRNRMLLLGLAKQLANRSK